jgi:hypothetical protein
LADDLGVKNVSFIESDIMTLMNIHHDTYDLVFTSEGAIGWLPDLNHLGQDDPALFKAHRTLLCFRFAPGPTDV